MKMTKLMGLSAAAALALGVSVSAMADVTVVANVNKTATKNVNENVTVDKTYDITATQKAIPTNSAEADAVKNDTNTTNNVGSEGNPITATNAATINTNSFDGATGVVGVNQSPGNMNNQGNATSIAMTKAGDAIVHGNSSVQESNSGNTLNAQQSSRDDLIDTSFGNGATGVFGVNQSVGHMNNQDNAVSLALGTDAIASLSQSDLGMTNTNGQINDFNSTNNDTLTTAFGGAAGVSSVNQSSGSLNNQANTVSIAATAFPTP